MKKILFILISIIALSCSSTKRLDPHSPTGSDLIGGTFNMENQFGKKVTNKDYIGQYTLVFFGFSNCSTVCPIGLSSMGRALAGLPEKISKQIQPIFVTVDPERDTHESNAKFVKHFHPRFIALRGTLNETQNMVRKYRGFYRKVASDKDEYMMDHSDIIYLMNKEGKYLAHFSSSTEVTKMVNFIKKRIK